MASKAQTLSKRDANQAMLNGIKCKCPACGEGNLYRAYLKVNDTCPNCGEELFHHRADDAPPYIAIFVVGHLIVGLMLHLEMTWHVNPMVYIYTMVPASIIMPLAMLPSIKGAVVALQWSKRMFGFDPNHKDMPGF